MAVAVTYSFEWYDSVNALPREQWKFKDNQRYGFDRPVYEHTPSQWAQVYRQHSSFSVDEDDSDEVQVPPQPPMSEEALERATTNVVPNRPPKALYSEDGRPIRWWAGSAGELQQSGSGIIDIEDESRILHLFRQDSKVQYDHTPPPESDSDSEAEQDYAPPHRPCMRAGITPTVYPLAYQGKYGNAQVPAIPTYLRRTLAEVTQNLTPGETQGHPWLRGHHTQFYNNITHSMKSQCQTMPTAQGHVTASAIHRSFGQTRSKRAKQSDEYVHNKMPHHRINSKILNAKEKDLRIEYNLVLSLEHAHSQLDEEEQAAGRFDGEEIFDKILSPLCQSFLLDQLESSEFYEDQLWPITAVIRGDKFSKMLASSTVIVGMILSGLWKNGVMGKSRSQIPFFLTDHISSMECIINYAYTGQRRSLMGYGLGFGMITSLKRRELPVFTQAITPQGERSKNYYAYQPGLWPLHPNAKVLVSPSLTTCKFYFKEVGQVVSAIIALMGMCSWELYHKDGGFKN
ncbi:hypothetical protein M422DRAFT_265585 [Sphaerobolus stellatus SS14]|uniref:Uncharacterized protein n=1 Tax=Sphaerobolus stellatus (strain SS14) TaxID=990650 RepID=A0A0C9TQW4_SPHS4|nr:hypothetical protein M422DRAFT_265585 [Sphaerobolus stellatus SS14]